MRHRRTRRVVAVRAGRDTITAADFSDARDRILLGHVRSRAYAAATSAARGD
jgi:ATP-dependent Zn protease